MDPLSPPPESYLPAPKPAAADLRRRWIYYRHAGLGRRVHKAFVQAVRKNLVLELASTTAPTNYPQYVPYAEVDLILSETPEEEAAASCRPPGVPAKTDIHHPV